MTDDLHLLTGAYALDSLDPTDRERFEQHLVGCERCRTEVRELRATVAELGAAESVRAPARLRDRVMAEVSMTVQLPPQASSAVAGATVVEPREAAAESDATDPGRAGEGTRRPGVLPPAMRRLQRRVAERPGRRRDWRAAVALVGAAAVAALAYGLGSWNAQRTQQSLVVAPSDEVTQIVAAPDAHMSTLTMKDGADSKVIVSPSMGKGVVIAEQLPTPPKGMVYKVWVMDRAGSKHGMETFMPDTEGDAEAMLHGDFAGATRLELTVEPMGGSDQPSTPPVGVAMLN